MRIGRDVGDLARYQCAREALRPRGRVSLRTIHLSSQEDPLPVWELQEAELANALQLKVFRGEWTEDESALQIGHFQDRRRRGIYCYPEIDRVEMMRTFHRLSRETPRTGCRTMDIFHVACALQIPSCRFLTFDRRQILLARWAGLDVIVPPQLEGA